jgi:hypothetical protein
VRRAPHEGIVARYLRELGGHWPPGRCPACGEVIKRSERTVRYFGKRHHRRCVTRKIV